MDEYILFWVFRFHSVHFMALSTGSFVVESVDFHTFVVIGHFVVYRTLFCVAGAGEMHFWSCSSSHFPCLRIWTSSIGNSFPYSNFAHLFERSLLPFSIHSCFATHLPALFGASSSKTTLVSLYSCFHFHFFDLIQLRFCFPSADQWRASLHCLNGFSGTSRLQS